MTIIVMIYDASVEFILELLDYNEGNMVNDARVGINCDGLKMRQKDKYKRKTYML